MIPERVKALFKFIEFLYDNIDNFKQYQSLINELQELNVQRNELRPRENFKDKLKYDELQKIFHAKLDVIIANIVRPTLNKAFELNICDSDFINSLWNWNASEIHQLIEHFTKDDIDEILLHKWQYLQYRNIPNSDYYNSIFFTDLDNTLLPLFNFFKEDAVDELEAIETKTIQFSSIAEMVEQFKQGNKNVSFQLVNNEEQSTLSTNKLEQAISEHLMIPETKEIIVTPDNIHHYKYLSVKEGEHVEKRTLRNYKGKNDLPLLYAKHLHNHLKKPMQRNKILEWLKLKL